MPKWETASLADINKGWRFACKFWRNHLKVTPDIVQDGCESYKFVAIVRWSCLVMARNASALRRIR